MSGRQISDEQTCENQSSDSDEETCENQPSDKEVGQISDEEGKRCVVSDPALPHYLSRRAAHKTKHKCFSCGKRSINPRDQRGDSNNFHYYCTICQVEFHRECHDYPSKLIHPFHPQHPLTFTFLHKETDTLVETNCDEYYYCRSTGKSLRSFHKTSQTMLNWSVIFDKCTWCGNNLGDWFYRCMICNFALGRECAKLRPPLTIQNPKNHHHPLSLFPRPLSFPCNVCGLTNMLEPGYSCYQCNYVAHQRCIDLPRVIKITRHPHRLSYTPYGPTKVSSCRICYKIVDIKYGQYFCNNEGCSYIAHSKCATHWTVWDRKELEWEPEKPNEAIEPPYEKVGDGLIKHFCHDHHYLKLKKYISVRDSRKQCQACMRSITSHDFYNCIECDYFLHELCANLCRKMDHLLHIHSLFLEPCTLDGRDDNDVCCKVCWRRSSGWKYKCIEDECCGLRIMIDVNCILVLECFTHESHAKHPLFISTTDYFGGKQCQGCKEKIFGNRLNCTICEFVLCYICATIPTEFYYKYDHERPMSLCCGESEVDDKYWCELCEKRLNPTEWFYTNKELCTTIHLKCLFGDSAYMKSGHTFDYEDKKVVVVGNCSSSRPICYKCHNRCAQPVYLKVYEGGETKGVFCSINCSPFSW